MDIMNQSSLTLEDLNAREVSKHVGGIIFVSLLLFVGLLGNIHVVIIFGTRMKPSNHRTFICFLCFVDLIGCIIGMPFVLVDLTHPLNFFMIPACKILRTVNYFMGTSSIFLMLVVTVDRFRKVCRPLRWQISERVAKILCAVVLLLAAGMSWPALILFGHSTVETGYNNITGVRCSTEDQYVKTSYQTFFNIGLIVLVFIAFVVHIILYSIICQAIRNHNLHGLKIKAIKSLRRVNNPDEVASTTEISIVSTPEATPPCTKKENKRSGNMNKSVSSKYLKEASRSMKLQNGGEDGGGVHVKNQEKKFRETRRMTIIFFSIIAIFFISYIPHLTLKIIVYSQLGFLGSLSRTGLIMYNTFIWCFFINNVANPYVYFFLDVKFRAEVMAFYRHLFLG